MDIATTAQMHNGKHIPLLGLGTWKIEGKEKVTQALEAAFEAGYRHIDTASTYGNEAEIGEAVAQSGIDREDLFITSKVWNSNQGYDATLKAFDETLARLGLEYLDLYLVHWPVKETRIETYRALEKLYRDGVVRAIGVSNFLEEQLQDLIEETEIKPMVNQFELSPFNYGLREELVEFCENNDIIVEAYSPLTRGEKLDDSHLREIAEEHDVTAPQVLIRWSLQHGNVVLPKSANPEHIVSNADVFELELSEEEMDILDGLNEDLITTMDPAQFD